MSGTEAGAQHPGGDLQGAARRGLLLAGAFVILALALAAVVTRLSGHGEAALGLLRTIGPLHLLAAWVVTTAGMAGLAARWRTFFPAGTRAPIVPLTSILFVGLLLNYALPGPVGEVVGAAMASRRFGVRTEAALAAGITARFVGLGLAGLGAFVFVESGAVPLPAYAGPWIRTATALLAVAAAGLVVLAVWPALLRRVAERTTGRLRFLHRLHASALHFADALGALGRVGLLTYVRGAGWALVGHAAVVLGIWLAARGLGQSPVVGGLVFTYAASTAGAIALFAFPGGQVGWDAMFATLLVATAGLDVASAMALALVVRLQQLSMVILGSVLLMRELRDGSGPVTG